ncbi:MAG: asparagine synthase-related protein, partial [Planctomycetota bacterium]
PAIVGRPVVRSRGNPGSSDPATFIREAGGLERDSEAVAEALSGMFAIFEFDDRGIRVMTDRLGFRPVYVGHDAQGRIRSIGTYAESVAAASGTGDRIDPVSVAELLVHNYITFPFTTRTTMTELPPASISTIDAAGAACQNRVLWEPAEPAVFPDTSSMPGRISEAMREAATDLTRGCDRIGVLLSGGADSRAVLGAVLNSVDDPSRVSGVTYVTRENNETRIASSIAESARCAHVLVQRDEHYFPRMLRRGLSLLGCELRGNCHGLGIADNRLADRFDVIIGGQLSDTLLKDHFMSVSSRHAHRRASLRQRLRSFIPWRRHPQPESSMHHTTGRALLEPMLTDDIREQMRARRSARLEEVRQIRPQTAEVWNRFWPCSRQDDSAHTLGNTRITRGDTLFAHTAIIDVASELSLNARVDGVPANIAICQVCGPLARIENANNGLPLDASAAQVRAARKARRAKASPQTAQTDDQAPWNAVESSWVDPALMQRHAEEWISARGQLVGSKGAAFLDRIVARGGDTLVGAYQDDLPSNTNHIAIQVGLWLDSVLETARPASADGQG